MRCSTYPRTIRSSAMYASVAPGLRVAASRRRRRGDSLRHDWRQYDLLALLFSHPQVYLELGGVVNIEGARRPIATSAESWRPDMPTA